MELLWVMYMRMVISRSAIPFGYFLARHSRLVSVSQIFLGSAGPELKWQHHRKTTIAVTESYLFFDWRKLVLPLGKYMFSIA